MGEEWSVYEKLVIGKLQDLHSEVKEIKTTLNSHIESEEKDKQRITAVETRLSIIGASLIILGGAVVKYFFSHL